MSYKVKVHKIQKPVDYTELVRFYADEVIEKSERAKGDKK